MTIQVFVDMDGVLADFDTGYAHAFGNRPDKEKDDVDWDRVRLKKDFYFDLPPMPDALHLWHGILALGILPVVLTGVPKRVPEASENKRRWVRQWLGSGTPVLCTLSKEKSAVCSPHDVLIDDWEKYKHLWEEKGGFFLVHETAKTSLLRLKSYLEERLDERKQIREKYRF